MNKGFKSATTKITTDCGAMYVIMMRDHTSKLVHIIADLGKSGTCAKAQLSAYCDLFSVLLAKGINQNILIMALRAATGHTCSMRNSCIDSLNRHIINVLENDNEEEENES